MMIVFRRDPSGNSACLASGSMLRYLAYEHEGFLSVGEWER